MPDIEAALTAGGHSTFEVYPDEEWRTVTVTKS
jgi:hypothetical protein